LCLPHLTFKNGAHIVALCAASDARGNAMRGMVVDAEITAPSLAFFLRGTHEVGSFIELLCQHQRELKTRSRRTNSGFFTAIFSDWQLEESPLVKW